MQYMMVSRDLKLDQLRQQVGSSNLESVLTSNKLNRVPNIGAQIYSRMESAAKSSNNVSTAYKLNSLNAASQNSDVFEAMALMGDSDWKVFQATDALPGTLKVPETITLPSSISILGDSRRVSSETYTTVMKEIQNPPHSVNVETFNQYFNQQASKIISTTSSSYSNIYQFFKIPWGNMSIYSSIADESKDFPVYPEELADGVKANYTTMPEIIYQYEPWQLYVSSGPRANSYTFVFHRDMWTGDHRDGKANELVRFCMANCYPEYNGSAVNSSITTLYMNGQVLIRGVLTDVTANWEGPLGLDNYYLVCKLTLNFVEVSPYPLNYWSVMNKPLIG